MPISILSQVLIRIFGLNTTIYGAITTGAYIFIPGDLSMSFNSMLMVSIGQIVTGIIMWLLAPKLSRLFVKPNDQELCLNGVTDYQLFATAFVCMGLYFTLDSFASVFNWFHFFTKSENIKNEYGYTMGVEPSYYELSESVLTLAAGIALILTAKNWAKKLTKSS